MYRKAEVKKEDNIKQDGPVKSQIGGIWFNVANFCSCANYPLGCFVAS